MSIEINDRKLDFENKPVRASVAALTFIPAFLLGVAILAAALVGTVALVALAVVVAVAVIVTTVPPAAFALAIGAVEDE